MSSLGKKKGGGKVGRARLARKQPTEGTLDSEGLESIG